MLFAPYGYCAALGTGAASESLPALKSRSTQRFGTEVPGAILLPPSYDVTRKALDGLGALQPGKLSALLSISAGELAALEPLTLAT